jgi:hypothetical protein
MPDAVKGASVDPVELAKDQTTGVLKITLPKDAALGDHRCTVKTKLKFNDLSIEDEIALVLHVK